MNITDSESLFIKKTNRRRALKTLSLTALAAAVFKLTPAEGQELINSKSLALPAFEFGDPSLAVIDLALNLEYLEANFYSYATTGMGIASQGVDITGRGKQGTVNVPSTTQVNFTNPSIAAYAAEITADEIAHVNFLRAVAKAGGHTPVAQPSIDLVNSFNTAAAAAGLGSAFNPFEDSAGDLNFLLGAFIFEDVGVTAYHGAISTISDKIIITAAAGIMGTEAYHAANIRNEIYKLGAAAVSAADAISIARNSLGGEGVDQGLQFAGLSNLVPADSNAIVFSRTAQLVSNIVYLGVNAKKGGFFPEGMSKR